MKYESAAPFDAGERELGGDVEDEAPVVVTALRNLVRRPKELDALHFHPARLPHLPNNKTDNLTN